MQVVINISKDDFEEICLQARMVEDTGSLFGRIRKAISHGTPLPKGHGRLIDADALLKDVRDNSESYFADDFAHEWVDVAPTIIEKDEEQS